MMQKLLLDGLDQAVQQHVLKLFNVLIIDPTNEIAIERFSTGIANMIGVYDQLRAIITDKCDE